MATWHEMILGEVVAGIYHFDSSVNPSELAASLQAQGGQLFYLDGAKMTSKGHLMKELAIVLEFPDYFGANWDALHDCLRDLPAANDQIKQRVLLFDRWEKCASPDLLEVLQDALADWLDDGALILVLLRTPAPDDYVQGLPSLS